MHLGEGGRPAAGPAAAGTTPPGGDAVKPPAQAGTASSSGAVAPGAPSGGAAPAGAVSGAVAAGMAPGGAVPDEDLVRQACQGDHEAFAELVRRHHGLVYNLCLRLVGQPADAADATQEVFLRVFTRLGHFRGRARFRTWLYRIAVNTCQDELRRRRRRPWPWGDMGQNPGEGGRVPRSSRSPGPGRLVEGAGDAAPAGAAKGGAAGGGAADDAGGDDAGAGGGAAEGGTSGGVGAGDAGAAAIAAEGSDAGHDTAGHVSAGRGATGHTAAASTGLPGGSGGRVWPATGPAKRAGRMAFGAGMTAAAPGPNPEAAVLAGEIRAAVAAALAALPEPFRVAVSLRDLHDLSYEEIGAVLGLPPGTVRSRIHRGRLLLRDALTRAGWAPGTGGEMP